MHHGRSNDVLGNHTTRIHASAVKMASYVIGTSELKPIHCRHPFKHITKVHSA